MARFEESIPLILLHEGGLSDNKNDPGGITKYGISLRSLELFEEDINGDGSVNSEDIRALTLEKACLIYKQYFWNPASLDFCNSQRVATRLFDIIVNAGEGRALSIAKQACRSCTFMEPSEKSFKNLMPTINHIHEESLLPALRSEQAAHYRGLVAKNPDTFGVFLKGWLNRAYSDEDMIG